MKNHPEHLKNLGERALYTRVGALVLVLGLAGPAVARAQEPAGKPSTAEVGAPEASEPETGAPEAVVVAEDPGDVAPTKSLDDVAAEVDGLQETLTELKNTVDPLGKMKISGYIQARYEYHQDSADIGTGVSNSFGVRRGRVKFTYTGTHMEYMFQPDISSAGAVLRDAEATFVEPWTGLGLRLTMGQFKLPFGHQLVESSSERELPERIRLIRRLFPDERDRGVKITGRWKALRFSAAVVNGNGIIDNKWPNVDNLAFKDVVARVGVDFDWIVGGLSAYVGKGPVLTAGKAKVAADPVKGTPEIPATSDVWAEADKTRFGADLEVYFDVPNLGGLALKGEFVRGTEPTAASGMSNDVQGWYVLARQNLGDHFAVFARVDQYDANLNKENDDFITVSGGTHYMASGNVKLTATYDHISSKTGPGGTDPSDDIFTFQVQAMY